MHSLDGSVGLSVVVDAGVTDSAVYACGIILLSCNFTHACIYNCIVPNLLHLNKNSTSLTARWKLLLYLYINTFLMLKLILRLTFLRPAGSPPGGTEAIPRYGVPEVGASQTLKSSGTK